MTLFGQQHVLGLEVAASERERVCEPVDDAHLVQVLQREGDFRGVEARALLAELARLAEVVEQLAAGTVVQHEVQLVLLGVSAEDKTDGLERVLHTHDEWMIDLAEDVALRLRVLDLVLLLDHCLVQHLHRINLALPVFSHLEHLSEAALPDYLQDLKVADRHGGVRQLRVLIPVIGIIAAAGRLRVEGVIIAQEGEVDFLDSVWGALWVKDGERANICLRTHELLKGIHVLNVLVLHNLRITLMAGIHRMEPVLEHDTNRIDSLQR